MRPFFSDMSLNFLQEVFTEFLENSISKFFSPNIANKLGVDITCEANITKRNLSDEQCYEDLLSKTEKWLCVEKQIGYTCMFYSVSFTEERGAGQATNNITDAEKREEIYARNRNAISKTIWKSEKGVSRVVRGFFSDPIHLHKQFCYLISGVDNLIEKVP